MKTRHGSASPGSGLSSVGGSEVLDALGRWTRLTSNGVVVAMLAIGGWLIGRFISSRSLLLLVYGVVIVMVSAYLTGRRRLAVVAVRSDLPSRVREGQTVEVGLTLSAERGVSTILLEEKLAEQLGRTVLLPVPSLSSGSEVTHRYSMAPKLRGVYTVGPLTAVWSDPFGLTRHRLVLIEPTTVIVHPITEQVHDRVVSREWEDPPVRPPISRRWPTGFEFYGMRDYVNGDDPRRIVWRHTAKTLDTLSGEGRYLIREAEQGITDQVIIILDTDAEYHSPGYPSLTFETAVRAAASLGVRHLRDGFSVTIETNSGALSKSLRGRRDEIPLLDQMAAVTVESLSNSGAMDRLLTSSRGNAHYVLITPHLSRKTAARLRLMLDRNTSLLLAHVLWDGTDPVSLHRAGGLGCNVVELRAGAPVDRAFQRMSVIRKTVSK